MLIKLKNIGWLNKFNFSVKVTQNDKLSSSPPNKSFLHCSRKLVYKKFIIHHFFTKTKLFKIATSSLHHFFYACFPHLGYLKKESFLSQPPICWCLKVNFGPCAQTNSSEFSLLPQHTYAVLEMWERLKQLRLCIPPRCLNVSMLQRRLHDSELE